jgi:hypothetical protein
VVVANIIAMPKVSPSTKPIYQTATPEFRVNGTGLLGARAVRLEFSPALREGVDYEVTSKLPLAEDVVSVHLIKGRKWRETAGDLAITQIDTGAGPVALTGSAGVVVAAGKLDSTERWGQHSLWVENTAAKQLVYHDDVSIIINGQGFNAHAPGTALPVIRQMFHGHTLVECQADENAIHRFMLNLEENRAKMLQFMQQVLPLRLPSVR